MKRSDEEVRAEALTAYKNSVEKDKKKTAEDNRKYFEELKEKLPDLQANEDYTKFYLIGHEFSIRFTEVMRWKENGCEWFALSPYLASCTFGYLHVYDMVSLGRFIEEIERREKKVEEVEKKYKQWMEKPWWYTFFHKE
jgi:DNA repair exonuclease SbcCD ATPase subunit